MCSDVTLSECISKPKVAGSILAVVRQIFQPARCGCTLRVTSLNILHLSHRLRGPDVKLQAKKHKGFVNAHGLLRIAEQVTRGIHPLPRH
jgi:hypothetical protein